MKIGWILLLVTGLCVSPSIVFAQNKNREIGSFPQPVDTSKFAYKNKLLIFPIIAFSPETNWVVSIFNAYIFKTSKKDPNLRTSTMPSGFLYTLNDQILIALGANIFLPKEKYIIRFESSFSKFPDKFWGIGNNTPETAVENYLQSAEINPDDAIAHNNLCWTYALLNQPEDALPHCEQAVELYPDPAYYDSRGLAHALLGNDKEAIDDFQLFVDDLSAEEDEELTPYIEKRQAWIKALKKGDNPFTEEVLEELREE